MERHSPILAGTVRNNRWNSWAAQVSALIDIPNQTNSWSIASSSGWMRLILSAPMAQVRLAAVPCSVKLESDFWQRDRDAQQPKLTRDFDVRLHQVLIEPQSFGILRNKLDVWLTTAAEFEFQLGTHSPSDPLLIVSLGMVPDLICTHGKTACTFNYKSAPNMDAKWSFVVDQSCVRACIESLDRFIHDLALMPEVG